MSNSGPAPAKVDGISPRAAQDLMIAVAQSTATMSGLKDRLDIISQDFSELRDDHVQTLLVQKEINDRLKQLVGNGPTALEPIIPRLIRQQDEMLKFQVAAAPVMTDFPQVKAMAEQHDRLQFRIGLLYSGGGAVVATFGLAAWGWIKKNLLGWG